MNCYVGAALLALASGSAAAASGASIDLRAGGVDPLIVNAPDAASGSVSGTGRDGTVVTTSGYANLTTGKVGLRADATTFAAQDTFGLVQWSDNISFNSPLPGSVLSLDIRLTIDGTLSEGAQPNFSFIFGDLSRDVLQVNVGWRAPAAGTYDTESASFLNFGSVSPGWSTFGPAVFEGTVSVVSNGAPAYIAMAMRGNGPMNFSNTATFEISLPASASFTSESGVFLSAVPEASTFLYSIFGLAALLSHKIVRRRRAEA